MTQVTYKGKKYDEAMDIKGVITLTPVNNIEEKLAQLCSRNSIVLRFKSNHNRKYMFVKRTNGSFIWLYKLDCDNTFLLNRSGSGKEFDNVSMQELLNWIDFNSLEIDEA